MLSARMLSKSTRPCSISPGRQSGVECVPLTLFLRREFFVEEGSRDADDVFHFDAPDQRAEVVHRQRLLQIQPRQCRSHEIDRFRRRSLAGLPGAELHLQHAGQFERRRVQRFANLGQRKAQRFQRRHRVQPDQLRFAVQTPPARRPDRLDQPLPLIDSQRFDRDARALRAFGCREQSTVRRRFVFSS